MANCEVKGCEHEATHYFLCDAHWKELLEFPRAAIGYHFNKKTKTRHTVKRDALAILRREEPPGSINFRATQLLDDVQREAEQYRARKQGRPARPPRDKDWAAERGPM